MNQQLDAPKPTVLVALSGGVDSSVAAYLLQQQGYPLLSATLQLNPCEDRGLARSCCGVDAVLSARRVATRLGLEHVVIDCRHEFEEHVLKPAWEAYGRGLTPSPCILCNEHIKLGLLAQKAARMGATHIATGHYARIQRDDSETPNLLRGLDDGKDQAYFLFSLQPEQLDHLLLPLGDLTKPQVRDLAKQLELTTAERRESQDACLATSADGFAESLRLRFNAEPLKGPLLDADGRKLGRHEGIHRFTIGQRRGLGISVGHRAFVRALRETDGAVLLTDDERALWSSQMRVRCVQTAGLAELTKGPLYCDVQIRSRHTGAPARVECLHPGDMSLVEVVFDLPQRAITPGQAAVFFAGDRVLGGGWIEPIQI